MKSTLALLSFVLLLLISSFTNKQDATPLDGSWELRNFNYGGNIGSNPTPRNVKVFEDGKFGFYLLYAEGARKTIDGTYKVLDENFYTESIVKAANKPMIGQTYKIKYQIKDSLLLMSGTYDTPNGKVNYSETWVKVNPKVVASLDHKLSDTN
jgi:hypothetical protein